MPVIELGELERMAHDVGYFSSSKRHVKKAPCRKRRSLSEIKKHLDQVEKRDKKVSKTINGINFVNQSSELLESFEDLVTKKDFLGQPEKVQPDISKAKNCKDVNCAINAIWGQELGPKLLFLRQKFGMNGSELANTNSSRLKPDEIDSFIRALDDLPPHLTPLVPNRKMSHFTRGYTLASYRDDNVYANASMTFFDLWSEQKHEGDRDMVCTHELAHVVGNEFGLDSHPEWLKLSGWEDLGDDKWKATKPETFLSHYATTNPFEDFAETMTGYRYNPEALKSVSPEKYEFIKNNVYAGLEYTNQKSCMKDPPMLTKIHKSLSQVINSEKANDLVDLDKIKNKCRESVLLNYGIEYRRVSPVSLKECIDASIMESALKKNEGNFSELEKSSRAKHVELASRNSKILPKISEQLILKTEKQIHESIRQDIVDAFNFDLLPNIINRSDCSEMNLYIRLDDKVDKKYGDNLFGYRLKDYTESISRDYCEYQKETLVSDEVKRVDALYFVTKKMRNKFQINPSTWSEIQTVFLARHILKEKRKKMTLIEKGLDLARGQPDLQKIAALEKELESLLMDVSR